MKLMRQGKCVMELIIHGDFDLPDRMFEGIDEGFFVALDKIREEIMPEEKEDKIWDDFREKWHKEHPDYIEYWPSFDIEEEVEDGLEGLLRRMEIIQEKEEEFEKTLTTEQLARRKELGEEYKKQREAVEKEIENICEEYAWIEY